MDIETAVQIGQIIKDITADGTAVIMSTHNQHIIDSFPGRVFQLDRESASITELNNAFTSTTSVPLLSGDDMEAVANETESI